MGKLRSLFSSLFSLRGKRKPTPIEVLPEPTARDLNPTSGTSPLIGEPTPVSPERLAMLNFAGCEAVSYPVNMNKLTADPHDPCDDDDELIDDIFWQVEWASRLGEDNQNKRRAVSGNRRK